MKRVARACLFSVLCWSFSASAALPGAADMHYHARYWSIEQGLPQVSVMAVAQGADGYIWAGTQDGLARFDGERFETFTVADHPQLGENYISALRRDGRGRLWIGTAKGVSIYADGRFHKITRRADVTGMVSGLARGAGRMWVAAQQGLFSIVAGSDAGHGIRRLLAVPIHSVLVRADGAIWAGGQGGVWIRPRSGAAFRFQALPHTSAIVTALADGPGGVWAGTADGLYRWDASGGKPLNAPAIAHQYIRALFEDPQGRLWIGTDHGLFRLSGTGQLEDFRSAAGGPHQWVRSLAMDREGNLWFGTTTHGLARLWNNRIVWFGTGTPLQGLATWSLYQDGPDNIWIGSQRGVYVYRHGHIEPRFNTAALPDPMVSVFLRDGAELWIGTMRGLARATGGRLAALPPGLDGLPPTHVYALLKGRRGGLWIGTADGLYEYRNGRLQHIGKRDGLPNGRVRAIYEYKPGVVWVGTSQGLFANFDGHFYPIGLHAETVQSITHSGDSVWISLHNSGFARYHQGRFTRYRAADGLPFDVVFNAIGDGHGSVWLTNHKGIYRIAVAALDAFDAGRIQRLPVEALDRIGHQQPIQCDGGNRQNALLDGDGNFWCAMIDGVAALDTRHLARNQVPPQVVVESVTADGHDYALPAPHTIAPALGQRDLEFAFAGLSFSNPERVHYRYKLTGYDDDWIDAGTRNEAFYTGLPPGHYVFAVQAANNDGVWSKTAATASVRLTPFFYETLWFYALCAAAALLLLYLAFRLRLRQTYAKRVALEAEVEQRIAELRDANRRLATATLTDALTGLKNRRYLVEQIDKDIAQTRRLYRKPSIYENKDLAFFMLSVDGFGEIGENYGSYAGERLLVELGDVISAAVRDSDYVVHWGGEEFLVVARQTEYAQAPVLAERLRAAVATHKFNLGGDKFLDCTCSVGFCGFPLAPQHTDGPGWEELVALSQIAMRQARALGKNAWVGISGTPRADPAVIVATAKVDLNRLANQGQIVLNCSC